MPKPEIEFSPFEAVPHTPCTPPIDGLTEQILARNDADGTVTRVLTFQPGTDTSPNGTLTHDFWEEVFIFEGSFYDTQLRQEFRAGDYAVRPPGMPHGPWRSAQGARMFEVRYTQAPTVPPAQIGPTASTAPPSESSSPSLNTASTTAASTSGDDQ